MNTGNTYYFIDDFNKICKCKNGMKSDESIILETYELIDDINHLIEENEQLKEQLEICKDARQSYKQDWKVCVSYCDTYEDEIHTLKDNIQGVIEENEQLKKARKFFEEILFNVIYATADYQRLTLNKELLEVIDEVDSLDELREKANFGIEEFKKEHGWL